MSKLPTFEARTSANSAVDTDVVAVFQDSGKKAIAPGGKYAQIAQKFRKNEAFVGGRGSIQFVRFGGQDMAENALFIGLGPAAELTEEKARSAGGSVYAKLMAEKVRSIAIQIDSFVDVRGLPTEMSHIRLIRAFAEGLVLSAYSYDKNRSKTESAKDTFKGPEKISFITQEKTFKNQLDAELAKVRSIGEAVTVTRDWSNEPSNIGTPEYYANEAKRLARQYGLKCTVLSERDAAREKMGLFLSVGQGSEREGKIVVLEYNPKGVKNPKTIAFVGKGITFDSGGISIKPSLRMEEMKHDMTGASTMMGAAILASQWKVPNRIVTILAFTENMPSGNATQPGNVITARNGKTVEIINTDAEGRLILADALDFAQDFEPDAVIDAATLTGAVSVALGKQAAGVLGNDEMLIESLKRAGEVNGERVWQLPLWDEYFEDLKSDYADMKNSANDGNGGTIRGAIFLKQFIRKGVPWAHLDIAATAWGLTHLSYFPKKGASGIYVRTLAQFAADF